MKLSDFVVSVLGKTSLAMGVVGNTSTNARSNVHGICGMGLGCGGGGGQCGMGLGCSGGGGQCGMGLGCSGGGGQCGMGLGCSGW